MLSIWEEIAMVFVGSFRNESAIANDAKEIVGLFREIATVGNTRPSESVEKYESHMGNILRLVQRRVKYTNLVTELGGRSAQILSQ